VVGYDCREENRLIGVGRAASLTSGQGRTNLPRSGNQR
jgi:hypothetical protein